VSAPKKCFTFFTAEGVTFDSEGTSLANALRRAQTLIGDHTLVAVVETNCVVTPAAGKLTALIVRQSSAAPV
jgi:hypothetical protein